MMLPTTPTQRKATGSRGGPAALRWGRPWLAGKGASGGLTWAQAGRFVEDPRRYWAFRAFREGRSSGFAIFGNALGNGMAQEMSQAPTT